MGFDFSKVAEWINLKPRFWLGILLLSGNLLFLPPVALDKLGLRDFRDTQKTWIGLAFLGSIVLLCSYAAEETWNVGKAAYLDRKQLKSLQKQITELSSIEKRVLREYIENNETTRHFECTDGVVNGLVAKGVIFRASKMSSYYTTFPFNIQPWAWKYLNEHSEILNDITQAPQIDD